MPRYYVKFEGSVVVEATDEAAAVALALWDLSDDGYSFDWCEAINTEEDA